MNKAIFLLAIVSLGVACGGNVVMEDGTGGHGGANSVVAATSSATHGATSGTGSLGAGGSGGVDAGLACLDAGPPSIPAELKACGSDADCMIVGAIDCCTQYEFGVASAELDAFTAYEKACFHFRPPCPCAVGIGSTVTDGSTANDGGTPAVACRAGLCTTFMR